MEYDNDLVAYICVVDTAGISWFFLEIDKAEWTQSQFAHQN